MFKNFKDFDVSVPLIGAVKFSKLLELTTNFTGLFMMFFIYYLSVVPSQLMPSYFQIALEACLLFLVPGILQFVVLKIFSGVYKYRHPLIDVLAQLPVVLLIRIVRVISVIALLKLLVSFDASYQYAFTHFIDAEGSYAYFMVIVFAIFMYFKIDIITVKDVVNALSKLNTTYPFMTVEQYREEVIARKQKELWDQVQQFCEEYELAPTEITTEDEKSQDNELDF